jgi:biopolymer transport protein ExbD
MYGHGKKFSVHTAGGEEEPEFQVAPMVDVLLVLLMFFTATTTTEIKSQIADLTLPEAQDAKDKEKGEGQFVVNINRLGGLEQAGGQSGLTEAALSQLIKKDYDSTRKLSPNASYRVLVRADKNLGWEKTKVVLKAAATAGVANVVFATTKGGKG